MNHSFTPSLVDNGKCAKCRRGLMDHTTLAQCECCPNIGPCEMYIDILMCATCYEHEIAAQIELKKPENQAARVNAMHETIALNEVLHAATDTDHSITLVTDIFNAKTVAIVELKKAIDADDAITNKPFALAEMVSNRNAHLKGVIQKEKQTLTELENELRAGQVYLNQMSNQLRIEEREKLKISDINYNPSTKQVKPRSVGPKKPSAAQMIRECREWAIKLEIPTMANAMHMIALQHDMTPEQAGNHLKKMMAPTVKE